MPQSKATSFVVGIIELCLFLFMQALSIVLVPKYTIANWRSSWRATRDLGPMPLSERYHTFISLVVIGKIVDGHTVNDEWDSTSSPS